MRPIGAEQVERGSGGQEAIETEHRLPRLRAYRSRDGGQRHELQRAGQRQVYRLTGAFGSVVANLIQLAYPLPRRPVVVTHDPKRRRVG